MRFQLVTAHFRIPILYSRLPKWVVFRQILHTTTQPRGTVIQSYGKWPVSSLENEEN